MMMKKLSHQALTLILDLFNTSWAEGILPTPWKHAIVIPLLKKDKNPESPESYRPISLTSHLGKVMEVMVASRLRWFIESNGLLHPSQSGFRNGKSALDHIIGLHDTVYKALNH